MEKLLNLLNEYMFVDTSVCEYLYNKDVETIYVRTMLETGEIDDERVRDEWIISKRFGFIKWLVDNDKIDRDKVLISFAMTERDWLWNYYWHWVEDYQRILMLLSISDTPIDDLISYLK